MVNFKLLALSGCLGIVSLAGLNNAMGEGKLASVSGEKVNTIANSSRNSTTTTTTTTTETTTTTTTTTTSGGSQLELGL
ncbi:MULTISPECIES: hypothetical protein [Epilithonimonas]|uniref:hypothetical protein n=1 Tax=Epilithonimonas TaxID=2782229 RepID=UPI00289986C0|nr:MULTISPECIES: hypothetical protein [Epilithonimonas]